jgi:hypothetical protein
MYVDPTVRTVDSVLMAVVSFRTNPLERLRYLAFYAIGETLVVVLTKTIALVSDRIETLSASAYFYNIKI